MATKKIWDKNPNAGPTKVRDVYVGSFAKKCREYADKFYASSWCILSAKYGFISPDNIVPRPYNVSFIKPASWTITLKELVKQSNNRKMLKYEKIVVLGGKNYVRIVKQVFPSKSIHTPLSDCKGIGYMMKKLNDSILCGKRL